MALEYRTALSSLESYWDLFLSTGWNQEYHLSLQELTTAVLNSWCVIAAYEGERLVGFGRVVSHGVLHAMIYDLITDPGFQEQGIGTEVLGRLVSECNQAGIRDIQLFCAKGKRDFYEKRGFRARPDDSPGMEYAL